MRVSFFALLLLFSTKFYGQKIICGAERIDIYLPKLKAKNVAVACNHSSVIGDRHLVDILISNKIKVQKIMAPEHGFRGEADAGASVQSGKDSKTGISILSLYGDKKKPKATDMKGIDIVIFDIQDVGVRFYTYISTLQYLMEACADLNIPLLILDRPNPNGHYVDGPILNKKYKSFVGMQSVPIVYGMTIGEYAKMLVGEKWLNTKKQSQIEIISCLNYTHNSKVIIDVPPSPNLKSAQAIALYPSLCLFEGTNVSVGRGTDIPFEIYGSPYLSSQKFKDTFTPMPKKGAMQPPFLHQLCYGENLSQVKVNSNFDLSYLIRAYANFQHNKSSFFSNAAFFDKLAGDSTLRTQITQGLSESTIRQSWQPDLQKFKAIRKKYVMYNDF